MVVGAGISGIRSALDLAESGYQVTLLDRAPHIGGILSQLDYQFPSDGCGMCRMLPLIDRDASSQYCLRKGLFHENIQIILGAKLTGVDGEPGNFSVTIEQTPGCIDPTRCIGCGACADACPVEVQDAFNMNLSTRKAVYLPVPHNIPNTYVIDLPHCTRCGECLAVCPTDAIKFPEERRKDFHILVVDDELIVRDSLKEWLDDEGFSVDMADSGPTALEMLAEKEYQLVLTDIKMPGMDGVEMLKQALQDHPDLSVVMMTAYATVETAVDALKTGALDYLLKPFDPETFTPKILEIYQAMDVVEKTEIKVHSLVLSTGTETFDPARSRNTYGYGVYPDVVSAKEFERMLSGTGPDQGRLQRRSNGGEVKRIAWLQCVGSRDIQVGADFCSSVCCMHAVKEARLVREKFGRDSGEGIQTTIFYMDLRAFGKGFYQYCEEAENKYHVRFEPCRVHTVIEDPETGLLRVFYMDEAGSKKKELFDLIVLSTGQAPSPAVGELARMMGLELNPWGFCRPLPFSTSQSGAEGIFYGGSTTGMVDISESVIQAGAASLDASRFIHSKGGSISSEPDETQSYRDVSRELPKILVVACACEQAGFKDIDAEALKAHLLEDPTVSDVLLSRNTCTASGWEDVTAMVSESGANRILISACLPYAYLGKIRELASETGLHPGLIHSVDIRALDPSGPGEFNGGRIEERMLARIKMGISKLKRMDPPKHSSIPSVQRALVVGGGVAGMTAAKAMADHGVEVDLIDRAEKAGGNLTWLSRTIDGQDVGEFLKEMSSQIEKSPLIHVHQQTSVTGSFGWPGHFITTAHNEGTDTPLTFEHGAVVLATGGSEARTTSYGHGESNSVVTHKELEEGLKEGSIDPAELQTVVMIQCVDSREESKKNYCSRVCCTSSLKYALDLKEKNPELDIYILYRDLMSYGFFETYYTQARQKGIIFIRYDLDSRPDVSIDGSQVSVSAHEPLLDREIVIDTDLVVLATGISPELPGELGVHFGVETDEFGFFKEADTKWRPVDALKEGVFACGLCLSPRNITETIASAQAAAQRALRILGQSRISAGKSIAVVHQSLCSLCERCIEACPYGARFIDADGKVAVNPLMCQGCGSCAAVCPNSASSLADLKDQQVFDMIDSIF